MISSYVITERITGKVVMSMWDTPWKVWNQLWRWLVYPQVRLIFVLNGISWGRDWRFFGVPIIQKHRRSHMSFGPGLSLRSSLNSNPLSPNHPVVLTTWLEGACLKVGANFAMTGGTICCAENITIGDDVSLGANSVVTDTDFHPLTPYGRKIDSSAGKMAPIIIEDEVFIGLNCLILKGVTIGEGSVVGAGSVVTKNIPPHCIAAGNPAKLIRYLDPYEDIPVLASLEI